MRCQTLRSAFRAVIAAGLIASCQNATLNASWNDSLHPVGGTCFVHDLQWDQFHSPSRAPFATKSVIATEPDILSVAAHETDLCIAAAKQFELRMHVDAIISSIGMLTKRIADNGTNLLFNFSRSRIALVSSIENSAVELVQWIKIPNSLPLTIAQSADDLDFEGDWNCGQWCQAPQGFASRQLPLRDGPNVFVYSLNSERKSLESDLCLAESDFFQAEKAMDTISNPVSSVIPTWQVGIDPVCPEVNESSPACRWSDNYTQPSICCPLDHFACEAIAAEPCAMPSVPTGIRPPTLDAEYNDQEAALAADYLDEPTLETARTFSPWSSRNGMRFAFGDHAPRMPESQPPFATFSKEDLQTASRSSARTLGDWPCYPDFAESKPNGILLPLSYSHRMAIDFAMNAISNPVANSRVRLSKGLASPIRMLGQFLVDFAGKLDTQIEQIEMARRDINQR